MTGSPLGELALGLAKIHVLHHAGHRQIYGLWLLEELAEHGFRLSPGTLYPLLARMEQNGWLRQASTARAAKGRRSLAITATGRRVLRILRTHVAELYREVVLGDEQELRSTRTSTPARIRRAVVPRRRARDVGRTS